MCVYVTVCVSVNVSMCVYVYSICVCMCVLAALSIFPQVCAFSIRPLNSRLACLVHSLSLPLALSFSLSQSPVCSGAFYSASDKFFGSGRGGGKRGEGDA